MHGTAPQAVVLQRRGELRHRPAVAPTLHTFHVAAKRSLWSEHCI